MELHVTAGAHARANGRPAFNVGQRVQLHPGTSAWMQGDRLGTVTKVGRALVTVRLDRSGRALRCHPANVVIA